jgi:pimeloyl-ACP methyl ester carboxylesterase
MAHKYQYGKSAQRLYFPAEAPPFFETWEPADTADHDLLCAEMSRLAYADKGKATTALASVGFTMRLWMGGETPQERQRTLGTDGFVATHADGTTVLAFRGTESNKPEDLLADGFATAGPWVKSGLVHEGFARSYEAVRGDINEALRGHQGTLLVTGHSLGAGLATLAAAEHAERTSRLITFGAPRVGDQAFARLLVDLKNRGDIHQFVDCCDLVTRIPPERFDRPHIAKLLDELIPASLLGGLVGRGLVAGVAEGLAVALAALHIDPHYVDVAEAIYRDRNGKALTSGTTNSADQQAARAAYQGGALPDFGPLAGQAVAAFAAARDANAIRAAVRRFATGLFQVDPVPLRDLADHAPINYVTLFTARLP